MSTPSQTEGSLHGLGAGLMLPARGNPFGKAPPPPGVELLAVGAERGAPPNSLSPALAPVVSAAPRVETLAVSIPPEVPMPEPRDLTPEDLMALFPSSHAERDLPQTDLTASAPLPAEPTAAEPLPDWMLADVTDTASAPAAVPAEPVSTATAEPAPAVPLSAEAPVPAAPPVENVKAPAEPAPVVLVSAGVAEAQPAASALEPPPPGVRAVAARPAASAAADAVAHQPGLRLTSSVAPSGGSQLTLDLAKDDLQTTAFDPGASLPADASLSSLFVPDGRLMTLWLEIDSVEANVTSTRGMSQCVASEMLDRLQRARNLLMNDRAQFEEAARQVAEVKFHLTMFSSANFLQQPLFISLYLLACFALVFVGVAYGQSFPWDRVKILNIGLDNLWYTMLTGLIGGVTSAVYGLVSHVARDRDYDPQFWLWYYQSPWMGLILGIFVYIGVYILMNLGSLVVNQQGTSGSLISTFITLFFAWLAGFKHNIAFDLADMVMGKLMPADQKPADAGSTDTKSE
jgi:hypothetical protein